MADADVKKSDFDQMWQEMLRLSDAWHDRHGISGRGLSGMFLQYGASVAHVAGVGLDEVLNLVRKQWTALEEAKKR